MIKHYISGWEALNIPNECGISADWHALNYFNKHTINNLPLYDYNEILQDSGISKRFIRILDKEIYIASFARAITDLVYLKKLMD